MASAEAVYLLEVKWVLPLVLLVGCWNDEPGLHLEVRAGTTGATRIELYLATRPCVGCADQLKPQGVRNKLPGPVWLLDGTTTAKTLNTVYDLTRGKVVIDLLPPGDKDVDVEYVVAVGYDAADTVVGIAKLKGVTIPHGRAKFWKVTLDDAADQASSKAVQPVGNRVWVWRRSGTVAADLAACVGIEVSDGETIERTWLVPEDDTDCDGVESECDFYSYKATGNSELADANCVKENTTETTIGANTCLVGGPACVDGGGNAACGAVLPYYCAPTSVCANPLCRNDLIGCVTTGAVSYLKVAMPSGMSNERCTNVLDQSAVVVDLAMFVPPSPTTAAKCTGIKFAKLELDSISLDTEFRPNGAEFKVGLVTAPCKFLFSWVNGSLSNTSAFTFMDLELDNGTHELLPLRVELTPGECDPQVTAQALPFRAADEHMTNCALAKP
jgi:hypothetical protein